ncbi:MAG: ABC transporter substrate-binding protein, partial [Alphaproteobacteria bacterium]|nr:ABC transporter substrate-binding protein [Alphaproteobacteria bacterium]
MRMLKTLLIAGVTAIALTGPASAQEKVLRVIPQADLKNLDPIWTTAAITINHGYMIYDTLFALDSKLVAKPQMVDTFTRSPDGMKWSFTLRSGM